MTNHEHDHAIDLIARCGTEEIAAAESAWLEAHLSHCPQCARQADDFQQTGRFLRAVAVAASPRLVAATQQRVRARALQLREQQTRTVLIAISFCLGAISSGVSGWMWWRFGAWIAEHVGLSRAVVGPGIIVFLLLPAIASAVLMLAFPHSVFEGPVMSALGREREGVRQ
jgi:anti-sigma factor RsiW